jgi:magnesium-transporting ATPase (P-type)
MGFLGLTYELELELDLTKEEFREGLSYNVAKPKFGSFFADIFSTSGLKYKGTVDSESFNLTFPKSLFKPSHFYPVIAGEFHETTNGLKVNIKVSSLNWLALALMSQLTIAVLFATFLFLRMANDITDIIVMYSMLLIVLLPLIGIELYRMNKGARIAIEEIEKDVNRIETTYNKTYE